MTFNNLAEANFERANLEGANLEGAILEGANFEGANLREANLKWAIFKRANLKWTNLEGANLEGANLEGASLEGASLEGGNAGEIGLYGSQLHQNPIQFDRRTTWPTREEVAKAKNIPIRLQEQLGLIPNPPKNSAVTPVAFLPAVTYCKISSAGLLESNILVTPETLEAFTY